MNKENWLERDLNLRPPDWRAGALPNLSKICTQSVSLVVYYMFLLSSGTMLKSLYQNLANACSMVDCCFGMRPCHQAIFPCIRSCSYGDRKVFYNYDGTETVEPLVDYFKPTNSLLKRNVIRGEFFFFSISISHRNPLINICLNHTSAY